MISTPPSDRVRAVFEQSPTTGDCSLHAALQYNAPLDLLELILLSASKDTNTSGGGGSSRARSIVSLQNNKGVTPLHRAAMYSNDPLACRLLILTDPNAMYVQDVDGSSPPDLADSECTYRTKRLEVMTVFKDAARDPHAYANKAADEAEKERWRLENATHKAAEAERARVREDEEAAKRADAVERKNKELRGREREAYDKARRLLLLGGGGPERREFKALLEAEPSLLVASEPERDDEKRGRRLMHYAADAGDVDAIETLSSRSQDFFNAAKKPGLPNGGDQLPLLLDNDRRTPLHVAAEKGHVAAVEALMSSEPDAAVVQDQVSVRVCRSHFQKQTQH